MHAPKSMIQIIDGVRYSVKSSTLIASDEYWDGNNFERGGRNTFLYKTKLGAYFLARLTQWQGERDVIEPIEREEAIHQYGELGEQLVGFAEAFDQEPQEPRGRPPMYGEKMVQTAIWLPQPMLDWLKEQSGSASDAVRGLIEREMQGK